MPEDIAIYSDGRVDYRQLLHLLRLHGRNVTTVDGALAPGVRPLIRRLGRLEDRMLLRGE